MNGLGAALFRYRLAVIVGFFGAAVAVALFMLRHPQLGAEHRVLASTDVLLGIKPVFLATGVVSLVAFLFRASGEARLGSVVYGQGASKRVVTGGPFRLMRHPLYVGASLFYAAAVVPYLAPVVAAVLVVAFTASFVAVAAYEEGALREELGEPWDRYAAAVPRFFGVPHAVDDDGIRTTAGAWASATLGNLGLLSTGLYRVAVAAGAGHPRLLGAVNLVCLVVWVLAVLVRRARNAGPRTEEPAPSQPG